jgi:hypothetical protein
VSPGSCAGPEDERGEEYAAAVVEGLLVVSGGDGPPLLEFVEEPLDDVATLVEVGVEGGRASTGGAAGAALGPLVGTFGNRGGNAAGWE